MTIPNKYQIGDNVYYIRLGRMVCAEITQIDAKIVANGAFLMYTTKYGESSMYEKDLFPTEAPPLAHLLETVTKLT